MSENDTGSSNPATVRVITESRNLRTQPFSPVEDPCVKGKQWEDWLESIERELRYFRVNEPSDKKDALIIYGGQEIARLEKSIPDPSGNDASGAPYNDYSKLVHKLNNYFKPKQNKHYARYNFLKTKCMPGESTISYAARLRGKASQGCDFGGTADERILEHLVLTMKFRTIKKW